jgi:Kdo2-lipid IVA lauroyltransferase/acyltransferase
MKKASAFGGKLAESIGPFLSIDALARRNMQKALPHLTETEIDTFVKGMWNNIGRCFAELQFLKELNIDGDNISLEGEEYLDQLRNEGKGSIAVTAHFGQWELLSALYKHAGLQVTAIYREANNPLVEKEIQKHRADPLFEWVPKGRAGARAMLRGLKQGRVVTTMNDQKLNNGIAVPFFGRNAMTATAVAEFSLNRQVPIIPVRAERLENQKFKLVVSAPLVFERTGNRQEDIKSILLALNSEYENWITSRPDLWLWVHNRWPD